ncbi:MAG TPA: sulfatase-like hydrolase/transferase [Polyangiaceae bacterium]|nr:sulfatase-like hydrolase/transferase [Polyangiaceae bacterium]
MPSTLSERDRGVTPARGAHVQGAPQPHPFVQALRAEARPYLRFLLAWTFLNVALNARYPAWRFHDPHRFWFLPSPDVTAMLGLLCLLGWRKRRLPSALLAAAVAFVLLCRVLRFGDGIAMRFLSRAFSLIADASLIVELARLLWSTSPAWQVVLGGVALVGAFVALGFGARAALRHCEAYLARPAGRAAFLATVAACGLLSWAAPEPELPTHRLGAFGTSATARLLLETDVAMHLAGLRDTRWRPLREASARVEALPTNLARLGSTDVLFFFIESYGHVVVSQPEVRAGIEPAWARFERALGDAGYGVRSSWLESPTYGGGSWLAHSTLASGAKITDQFAFSLLAESGGKSLAWAMRRAGYRTVLAAPGTTRSWPHERFFDFDKVYKSFDFGYQGPRFSWAPMPDQFVLDVLDRRETSAHDGPLFLQCILVSSHAPYDVQPPLVADWAALGDGSIYRSLDAVRFPGLTFSNQGAARPAYVRSLEYDFEVLAHYLTRSIRGGALVILVGDHQPTPELTDQDADRTVPIHIVSRNPELLAPFERRGYGHGMTPAGEPRGMETFPFTLFEDFSSGSAADR